MKALLFIVAPLLAILSAQAAAESPPPFKKETEANKSLLSYQLEREFSNFMAACGGVSVPLKMKKPGLFTSGEIEVSSIDYDVIEGLKLRSRDYPIESHWERSLGRIFGYVFTEPEKTSPGWNMGQFLRLDYADQGKMLAAGFPELKFEATCGSIIEGATRSSGEYNFPVATIKGALSAEYNDDKKSSLQIAKGRLLSPIWEMWASENANAANPGYRFYAGMLFWDWWGNKPPGNYSLMTYFDGTFLFRQTERQSTAKVSASTEASLTLPMVSASGELNMQGSRGSTFSFADFHAYIDVATGASKTMGFEDVPTVAVIVSAVQQNTRRSNPNYTSGQIIENSEPKLFWVDIFSMPASFCNDGWEVRDSAIANSPSNSLSFVSIQPAGGNSTACRFMFQYTPSVVSQGEVSLTPTLFSQSTREGKRLIIPGGTVAFSRNTRPAVGLIKSHPMRSTSIPGVPNRYELTWTLDLRLDDEGKFANINSINVDSVQISCPENTFTAGVPVFTRNFIGEPGPTVRTLQLTGKVQYEGASDPATAPTVQCTLAGNILFLPGTAAPIFRNVPPVPLTHPRS